MGQKVISIFSILVSSLLLILNSLYIYYWNLAAEFLGRRPYAGSPDPKDMDEIIVIGNTVELKEIVVDNYELVYNSIGVLFFLFLALTVSLILVIIYLKGIKRIVIFLYGVIAILFSYYIMTGGFFEWIAD